MALQPHQTVLFIGDSITDCGRRQPVGEAPWDGLGNGYVNLFNAMVNARRPDLQPRVINVGTSGHTVRDLASRWDRDVFDLKPDWVSIMIGINDVWRHFDTPRHPQNHVGIEEYAEKLRQFVSTTRGKGIGVVLATPFFIDFAGSDPMQARTHEYGDQVRAVAAELGVPCVDTQAAFDRVLKHLHSYELASDRVHPNVSGHMVLAEAFYSVLIAEGK